MALVTYANLVAYYDGEARLLGLAVGDSAGTHPKIDTAITRASDEMLGYLDRRYGTDFTQPTTIEPLLGHTCALAIDWLTRSKDVRAEAIDTAAAAAKAWGKSVADGKISVSDLTEDSPEGSGGAGVRYGDVGGEPIVDGDTYDSLFDW